VLRIEKYAHNLMERPREREREREKRLVGGFVWVCEKVFKFFMFLTL
jgi:hypothetical protein